jgi:hypothetical protein
MRLEKYKISPRIWKSLTAVMRSMSTVSKRRRDKVGNRQLIQGSDELHNTGPLSVTHTKQQLEALNT